MKVTVKFKETKIVVPCADKDSVGDVVSKAVIRYRKATGKPSESSLLVRALESSDGGLLDYEDSIVEVADDREMLIAIFDDCPSVGDGASSATSSMEGYETSSRMPMKPQISDYFSRRGSEPNLLDDTCYDKMSLPKSNTQYHFQDVFFDAPSIDKSLPPNFQRYSGNMESSPRASIKPTSHLVESWMRNTNTPPPHNFRRDPLGSSLERGQQAHNVSVNPPQTKFVCIPNDTRPLGIQVVPSNSDAMQPVGLLVRSFVDSNSKAEEAGLAPGDIIAVINGTNLHGLSFTDAQYVLRQALKSPVLNLTVISGGVSGDNNRTHTPSVANSARSSSSSNNPYPTAYNAAHSDTSDSYIESKGINNNESQYVLPGSLLADSMSQPVPPLLPARHTDNRKRVLSSHQDSNSSTCTSPVSNHLSSTRDRRESTSDQSTVGLAGKANTKRIGTKIAISLKKEEQGLGFSVTTRDTPTGDKAPVYIKSILQTGAAVADGRLKPGDRLLEVNSKEMTGLSQMDAVNFLRWLPVGEYVHIVVSRQEEIEITPQDHPNESDNETSSLKKRDIYSFEIALNDTGSAGLGINVKGKTMTENGISTDKGVFIKRIISGGAAWRDGRLKINDQLLAINNKSLVDENQSNNEAMEILRNSLVEYGQMGGDVELKIARWHDLDDFDDSSSSTSTVKLLAAQSAGFLSFRSEESEEYDISENKGDSFTRDGFARTSLSDKRASAHHLDVRQTDFYINAILPKKQSQTISEFRRVESVDSGLNDVRSYTARKVDVGSYFSLPKSSSLESLQTAFEQAAENKDNLSSVRGVGGPTESFRAAVDHSFATNPCPDDSDTSSQSSSNSNNKSKKKSLFKGLFKIGTKNRRIPEVPPVRSSSDRQANDESTLQYRYGQMKLSTERPQSTLPYNYHNSNENPLQYNKLEIGAVYGTSTRLAEKKQLRSRTPDNFLEANKLSDSLHSLPRGGHANYANLGPNRTPLVNASFIFNNSSSSTNLPRSTHEISAQYSNVPVSKADSTFVSGYTHV